MDKSRGANLYLWCFPKRAVTREFIYTWSSPSPQPPTCNVGHVYKLFLQSFNIVLGGGGGGGGWGGGKATQFKTDNSALFLNSVLKTQKINAITQVSQGILSTIVWFSRLMEKCTITMFFSPKCI